MNSEVTHDRRRHRMPQTARRRPQRAQLAAIQTLLACAHHPPITNPGAVDPAGTGGCGRIKSRTFGNTDQPY